MKIKAIGPEYLGAPYPEFDPKRINERNFEPEMRFKEYEAEYDTLTREGRVKWLSQRSDSLTDKFKAEVIRAFKANGANPGDEIYVEYGDRYEGYEHMAVLTVD